MKKETKQLLGFLGAVVSALVAWLGSIMLMLYVGTRIIKMAWG